ncbi:MAG: riboflavin synthase [Candidatus Peregrinibacteria bacterium]
MFTGIIETSTPVLERSHDSLTIVRPKVFDDLRKGMSIAINGACLSVAHFDAEKIQFDVLSETFRKTNLGSVQEVNVERAMPANGRFEGHIVLGHVDESTILVEKKQEESGVEYIFELPNAQKKNENAKFQNHIHFLIEKGSITMNGTSLTIGKITDSTFSVFLIPITMEETTFGKMNEGDLVNIEYDYLAKIIIQSQIFHTEKH